MDVQTRLAIAGYDQDGEPLLGTFQVLVPGPPRPWKRAGRVGQRAYTPPEMEEYRNHIFRCWADVGCPRLAHDHWVVEIEARWSRPSSHFLSDGFSLSSLGRRMRYPSYCDLDNVLKHIDVFVQANAVTDDRYAIKKEIHSAWHQEPGLLFAFRGVS